MAGPVGTSGGRRPVWTAGCGVRLRLLEDEVEPRILTAEEPGLVGWSSLWPCRADDLLTFGLHASGNETALRRTLTTTAELPDDSSTGHPRHRVDQLLWSDLRLSYGQ
jgi:hypothetical protein